MEKETDKLSAKGAAGEVRSSRLPGFYELPRSERVRIVGHFSSLNDRERQALSQCGALPSEMTDTFIENALGTFCLPLGVATNFRIDGKDYLIPMAVEESSVVAAASNGAKLVREGGGFTTTCTDPIMTGQIQLLVSPECNYDQLLTDHRQLILDAANRGQESLLRRGGGATDLTWRYIKEIGSLVVHLHVNTCDAMGANIVNTMSERVSELIGELVDADETGLRILTNLTDRRLAKAICRVPAKAMNSKAMDGRVVAQRIVDAYLFAYYDIYRASTNNKGIMNGIDPVVIATGNDWRAIEAGAHAYVSRDGVYRPMAHWRLDDQGDLLGELELPMAVGTVGGVTRLHPTAQAALRLLGNPSAKELAGIICCVGLAQNLAALRALSSEGIQRGHMSLHQKNLQLLYRQGASRE